MTLEEKKALLYSILERAAEQLGDITEHVYSRYYRRCPEAHERFAELYPGGVQRLEGEMVEQVLYCIMEWYESPGEIEIILISTIPHHIDTLQVKQEYFSQLVAAVFDTLRATIPPHETGELAVLDELQDTLGSLVEQGAKFAMVPANR